MQEIMYEIYEHIKMTGSPVWDIFLFAMIMYLAGALASSDWKTPIWKRILRVVCAIGVFIMIWAYIRFGYAAIASEI